MNMISKIAAPAAVSLLTSFAAKAEDMTIREGEIADRPIYTATEDCVVSSMGGLLGEGNEIYVAGKGVGGFVVHEGENAAYTVSATVFRDADETVKSVQVQINGENYSSSTTIEPGENTAAFRVAVLGSEIDKTMPPSIYFAKKLDDAMRTCAFTPMS